jgi:hypothetical protein
VPKVEIVQGLRQHFPREWGASLFLEIALVPVEIKKIQNYQKHKNIQTSGGL